MDVDNQGKEFLFRKQKCLLELMFYVLEIQNSESCRNVIIGC